MEQSWADRLVYLGGFLIVFGSYLLFFKGPATNGQQLGFRIGVVGLGAGLAIVGSILKATSNRRGPGS